MNTTIAATAYLGGGASMEAAPAFAQPRSALTQPMPGRGRRCSEAPVVAVPGGDQRQPRRARKCYRALGLAPHAPQSSQPIRREQPNNDKSGGQAVSADTADQSLGDRRRPTDRP